MQRLLITLGAFAVLGATVGTSAAAASSTVYEIEGRLVDTTVFGVPAADAGLEPGDRPGVNWLDNDIWRARNVDVHDTFVSMDGATTIGSLDRVVSFNWDMAALDRGEVESTARCRFRMELVEPELGDLMGGCGGTLLAGSVVGHGHASRMLGTYELEEGGTPGVGPYLLVLEVHALARVPFTRHYS